MNSTTTPAPLLKTQSPPSTTPGCPDTCDDLGNSTKVLHAVLGELFTELPPDVVSKLISANADSPLLADISCLDLRGMEISKGGHDAFFDAFQHMPQLTSWLIESDQFFGGGDFKVVSCSRPKTKLSRSYNGVFKITPAKEAVDS